MPYNPLTQGMGITNIGVGDPNVIFKRKNRWTFEIENQTCGWKVPTLFVKVAARPNISIEEVEINFLNDKTWIPGKAAWESITITYMDVAGGNLNGEGNLGVLGLYSWLASVYEFTASNGGKVLRRQASKRADYSGTGTLRLFDGCGHELERWIFEDIWPQAINFGDLDFSSSETVDIELTMRYSKVKLIHICPQLNINNCCTPC